MKKTENDKYCWGCGINEHSGTVDRSVNCYILETCLLVSLNLNICMAYDPPMPLLGVWHLKLTHVFIKKYIDKNVCSSPIYNSSKLEISQTSLVG